METYEKNLIEIDGSYGEGGGQILRTALAFSAILKRPVRVHHIRAGRKKPGLQPQHLKGVEALARMTEGQAEGVQIGSDTITFIPKNILSGDYKFDVGTAGSVTLLLQGLLLPLCLSQKSSRLTLVGGTHVPWSPPFHYLNEVLFPTLKSIGISVDADMKRWGWYPKGGGILHVEIKPVQEFKPVSLIDRGPLKKIRGLSATSHLPRHVGERQRDYALRRIEKELKMDPEVNVLHDVPANGPGSFFFLVAESEGAIAGFSSLGERGKRAEEVAKEAVDSLKEYVESDGCIDPHLADQLIPFISLAKRNSLLTTTRITEHLLTNLWVVQHFLNVRILRRGEKGEEGRVDFIQPPY
jgi:RNA 3'-terminal phosphate cyclase (ATP)